MFLERLNGKCQIAIIRNALNTKCCLRSAKKMPNTSRVEGSPKTETQFQYRMDIRFTCCYNEGLVTERSRRRYF